MLALSPELNIGNFPITILYLWPIILGDTWGRAIEETLVPYSRSAHTDSYCHGYERQGNSGNKIMADTEEFPSANERQRLIRQQLGLEGQQRIDAWFQSEEFRKDQLTTQRALKTKERRQLNCLLRRKAGKNGECVPTDKPYRQVNLSLTGYGMNKIIPRSRKNIEAETVAMRSRLQEMVTERGDS